MSSKDEMEHIVQVHNTLYMRHITTWHRDLILWIENFSIDVCMHMATYGMNSGTSMNCIQEYVSITISVASRFPHL